MNLSLEDAWLAIVAMAILTYLTRSLPFFLSGRSKMFNRLAEPNSPLSSLGPCLLVAITAATILPILFADMKSGGWQVLPTVSGLLSTLLVMKVWENVGLAVIVGMVAYTAGFVVVR